MEEYKPIETGTPYETQQRNLAIDDCREFGWVDMVARTYSAGLMALQLMGPWDVLHLDHDLGFVRQEFTDSGRELTGYDVACFIEANPQFRPKEVRVVTDNAGGLVRIEQALSTFMVKVGVRHWRLR